MKLWCLLSLCSLSWPPVSSFCAPMCAFWWPSWESLQPLAEAKLSPLALLISWLFLSLWHYLVHLPPTEDCTHSRNRQGNCTHVHGGHACPESSYLHLEEQGSEGSLLEHSQTNDLNLFITKLFRNPCICQKYFLDIFLLQISGFQNKHDIL